VPANAWRAEWGSGASAALQNRDETLYKGDESMIAGIVKNPAVRAFVRVALHVIAGHAVDQTAAHGSAVLSGLVRVLGQLRIRGSGRSATRPADPPPITCLRARSASTTRLEIQGLLGTGGIGSNLRAVLRGAVPGAQSGMHPTYPHLFAASIPLGSDTKRAGDSVRHPHRPAILSGRKLRNECGSAEGKVLPNCASNSTSIVFVKRNGVRPVPHQY
jgi:hypothetical protein